MLGCSDKLCSQNQLLWVTRLLNPPAIPSPRPPGEVPTLFLFLQLFPPIKVPPSSTSVCDFPQATLTLSNFSLL